uniref:Uncharacterized protein n=1 Tax=Anguilla anguilla TaxID=7936 RepID=A0A0E9QT07_ANGAN
MKGRFSLIGLSLSCCTRATTQVC